MGLFASFAALLMGSTQGKVHTVGDSLGWSLPPNESFYSDWASTETFFVGDILKFNWIGTHTVGDVSKADYDICNTKVSSVGNGTVDLNKAEIRLHVLYAGPRYFICTVGDHCSRGMKFDINVQSGNAAAAAEAPNAPSPPAFSAPPCFSSAPTLSFTVYPLFLSFASLISSAASK